MERTLTFFKPDAIDRKIVSEIYEKYIRPNGFNVVSINPVLVTRELILKHYEENLKNCDEDICNRVVEFYEGKMILVLILEKENAIKDMRKILGSTDPSKSAKDTIRGEYGDDCYEVADRERRSCRNIMHASDSIEEFEREYSVWFAK